MARIGLTVKLPALTVLAVVLTATVCGVLAFSLGAPALRRAALDDLSGGVRTYATAIKYYVDGARALIGASAGSDPMQKYATAADARPGSRALPLDLEASLRQLAKRVIGNSKVYDHLLLLDAEGNVVLVEPSGLASKLSRTDLGFGRWFQDLRRTGAMVVSDLHISVATSQPSVVIAAPVRTSSGKLVGVWAASLRLAELSRISASDAGAVPSAQIRYITDRRGFVVAHETRAKYVSEQSDFSAVEPVRAALTGQQGTLQYVASFEREERLAAFVTVPTIGWIAVNEMATSAAFAPITRLSSGIAVGAAGLALLLGGVGAWAVRRVVRPLKDVTAAAKAMAEGELGRRIEVRGGDEIAELADAFNDMAQALADEQRRLRAHAVELQQTAAELKRSNAELERFAYVASHDLQEPLRMVVSYLQLLERRYKGKLDKDADEFIGFAVDGGLRMRQIVGDILEFSRLGTRSEPFEAVDCGALMKVVLGNLKPSIDQAGGVVTYESLPVVTGDPAQLSLLLQNLISNAVKFHGERAPQIRVAAQRQDHEWRFAVADNGIGIAPEYFERIFIIFQRLHTRRAYPGTGIGLAICKKIVERHGGRIWVESEPGQGSAFYFTIPDHGEKTA